MSSFRILGFIVVACAVFFRLIQSADYQQLFVCQLERGLQLTDDRSKCQNISAQAIFKNDINKTGWAYLEVETNPKQTDDKQAYAAGVAEGTLTRQLIKWHWINTMAGYCNSSGVYCNKLDRFLQKNIQWIRLQLDQKTTEPYWRQVGLMLMQLAGLIDGYFGTPMEPHMNISTFGFLMFQLSAELDDFEKAFNKPKSMRRPTFSRDSCSAFIAPLSKNDDILFSHVTWSAYQTMLRIQKLYKFGYSLNGLDDAKVPSTMITMSSYPGTLHSIDDFYLLESKLAVTETTIGNSNLALYSSLTPTTVPAWIRVMVANRLAKTAKDWVDIFAKYNSGTYNNQFMVLDYKKFKPGQPLPKSGLFYIIEQIPGFVMSKDMTVVLTKQGYWPSYNIPYFKEIFNKSGNWEKVRKYGDWFTYEKAPRAQIFARDWQKVTDMDSLTRLMRYNNYRNDPLSACNCTPPYSAQNAISSRSDLNPAMGIYPFKELGHRNHGGTDMKATNYKLIDKLKFKAISGPTFDDVSPFKWSEADFATHVSHLGHPDLFAFGPVIIEWQSLSDTN